MPIYDVNGNPLMYYGNFPNDDIDNIEFGGGKNYFGKKEFPNCYITDVKFPHLPHFSNFPVNYENEDCHYIDYEFDFVNHTLNGNVKFQNLIFCNPHGFGFRGRFNTQIFLDNAGDILVDQGKIIIIGNSSNNWSKFENVEKWLNKLTAATELKYNMQVVHKEDIDDNHIYRQDYTFLHTDLLEEAKPNEIIIIQKLPNDN